VVRRVARRAGITKPVRPHTVRHAFITAALDAGVPLRDVQEAASRCVGVASPLHGQGIGTALVVRASQILSQTGVRACHIGWTTRESFYRRAGYQPWRRYAMYSSPA
jgi:GNAT superfamily N-acetyltransferase